MLGQTFESTISRQTARNKVRVDGDFIHLVDMTCGPAAIEIK